MKIIDRLKTSLRRDRRSTGHPIEGVADPASAERDRAGNEQNRDDERPAVSTAHETPEPEPATESATEPATDPVTEPATESATESATDPAIESATEPAAEPATEPTTAPAACPRCGATGEAPCTTPSGKATKAHKGREQ